MEPFTEPLRLPGANQLSIHKPGASKLYKYNKPISGSF